MPSLIIFTGGPMDIVSFLYSYFENEVKAKYQIPQNPI